MSPTRLTWQPLQVNLPSSRHPDPFGIQFAHINGGISALLKVSMVKQVRWDEARERGEAIDVKFFVNKAVKFDVSPDEAASTPVPHQPMPSRNDQIQIATSGSGDLYPSVFLSCCR
jgi:hypothetical protein